MAVGKYSKNSRVTVFHGGEKIVDGYFIGYTSHKLKREFVEKDLKPPAGTKGKPSYSEGDEDWTSAHVGDQFVADSKRDSPV